MLKVTIPQIELFDNDTNSFIYLKEQTICFEHSLVSVSKWESKWKKPFFSKTDKTKDEIIDYFKFMTITQNVDDTIYSCLPEEVSQQILDYIQDSMTATTFHNKRSGGSNREGITSELIYYWMFSFGIPIECQKWHINRLMTLIEVFNEKNKPGKKMSQRDILAQNRALNAARRR